MRVDWQVDKMVERGGAMVTTLNLDDDVMAKARNIAVRENKSVDEVISSLARKSLEPEILSGGTRNGVPQLPNRKGVGPVTMALVNQLRDED